jgi:hemerythrin
MDAWRGEKTLSARYERIFALMCRVGEAIADQRDAQCVAVAIEDFATSAEQQLTEEEEFLRAHHNPAYHAHLARHRFFEREVVVLKCAFRAGRRTLAESIVTFLKTWLTYHLFTACRKYGETLPEMPYGIACNR